nr:hypothetical protein [Tanacetum cinerariifolium]
MILTPESNRGIRSHGKTNGVFLCAGSLTNSLDTRNHLKTRTTFSSGQPGRPHLCINRYVGSSVFIMHSVNGCEKILVPKIKVVDYGCIDDDDDDVEEEEEDVVYDVDDDDKLVDDKVVKIEDTEVIDCERNNDVMIVVPSFELHFLYVYKFTGKIERIVVNLRAYKLEAAGTQLRLENEPSVAFRVGAYYS